MGRQIYVNLPIRNSHGFEDLDGHQWELMHMDPDALPPQS